jgi:hypothetical protein
MKKFLKLMLIGLSATFILSGCGSSSDDTTTSPSDPSSEVTVLSKSITVERGATYDANVTDADGQVAVQNNQENVYVFATTPKAPITAKGGWIDVDGDGELTANDIELDIEMKSYSDNITPLTTYIADDDQTKRDEKLADLVTKSGTSKEELLKVATKADKKAIIAINAIFQEMKEANSTNITAQNIQTTISSFSEFLTSDKNSSELAKAIEAKTISNLLSSGKISRISYSKMNGLQKFRLFGEKWENIKSIGNGTKADRYVGNKIKIVDGKFNLIASNHENNDSRAELRARLNSPISEFTAKVNGTSLLGSNGKVQVNAYMSNGGNNHLLTGITIRDNKISYWAENELMDANRILISSNSITTGSTTIKSTSESFENVNLSCQILTDGNKFQYIVKNLDTNETYPTQELDISSLTSAENQKFTILNVRVRFDHRTGNTLTSDQKNKKMKMILSDLDTK